MQRKFSLRAGHHHSHLNGDFNVALFKQFQAAGIDPEKFTRSCRSRSLEEESFTIGLNSQLRTFYAAWELLHEPWHPSLQMEVSFEDYSKPPYGDDRVVGDPAESAYNIGVYSGEGMPSRKKPGTTDESRQGPRDHDCNPFVLPRVKC